MAFATFVGSFTVPAATGNQAVTGVGFLPKAVVFFGTKLTADGSNIVGANIPTWWGLGLSSSSRVAMTEGDDGVTSNATATDNTKCIKCITGASTVTFAADLVSLDSDGFTVNFTTANATAFVVNYFALGGSDLSNVSLTSLTSATATGNQATTGVGFRPDVIVLMGADNSASNNATTVGLGRSSAARGSASQAGNATTGGRIQKTTTVYTNLDGGSSVRCEADLVSLDSDGFTLNWTTANANTHTIYALALKGGSFKVGSFTQKTSTGTQAVTGVSFLPTGLLTFSAALTAGAGLTANQCLVTAAVTNTTHRATVQYGTPNFGASAMDRTRMYLVYDRPVASANLLADADLSSFDADGFTPNYTTADATAREVIYLAMGNAVSTAQMAGIFAAAENSSGVIGRVDA